MKKRKSALIISMIFLFLFVFETILNPVQSYGTSFRPYKAVITAGKLSIRKLPSLSSKVAGYYTKGNVVSIIGQSGKFLKTSRGYIYSSYTKKYTPAVTVKPKVLFKAKVTSSTLNIRKSPSTSSSIAGKYIRGNIIDVLGTSGKFYKTSKGYVYSSYTSRISSPTRGNDTSNYAGYYVKANEDINLLISLDGTYDERYAMAGREYPVAGENGNYFKIKIGAAYGYVPKSKVTLLSGAVDNNITLAWQYIYARSSNASCYNDSSDYANIKSTALGLDVISPTWFDMTGDGSNPLSICINDKADRNFVSTLHKHGYEVWPRFGETNSTRAYTIFNNSTVKAKVINDIVNLAVKYNVDGINMDFEGIGSKNRDGMVSFVQDLYPKLKQAGISLSIDVTFISTSDTWSKCYDRVELSKYVDYMMVMAYDEHVSSSKEAGSVGSYTWVNNGISNIINEGVPSDKLILGVPFYLRDYKMISITPDADTVVFTSNSALYSAPDTSSNIIKNTVPGENYKITGINGDWDIVDYNGTTAYAPDTNTAVVNANEKYEYVVSGSAINMQTAYDNITKYNGSIYYDFDAKQNVGDYTDENGYKHLVWLEDTSSMAWRMDIVNSYGLKGAAAWSLGWETPDIWNTIKSKLK